MTDKYDIKFKIYLSFAWLLIWFLSGSPINNQWLLALGVCIIIDILMMFERD